MAKSIGSVDIGSTLELSLQLAAGTTGVPSSEVKVALRIAGTSNTYLDFNDSTFKTSGWTTRQQGLSEVSASNAPGLYNTTVNLAALTGLPAAGGALVAEYAATVTSPAFTEYSTETWLLTDIPAAVWDAPVINHQTADTAGYAQLISRYLGEYGPGVHVASSGVSTAVVGVDGVPNNPIVENSASIWTVVDALAVRSIYGHGSGVENQPLLPFTAASRVGYTVSNMYLNTSTLFDKFQETVFHDCTFFNGSGTNNTGHPSNTHKNCFFTMGSTAGLVLEGRFENCYWLYGPGNGLFTTDYNLQIDGGHYTSEVTPVLSAFSGSGFTSSEAYIRWYGDLTLTKGSGTWGSMHVHMMGGELTLASAFAAVPGAVVTVTGTGTLVNNATVSGWTLDTSGFVSGADLTPVTDAISTLSADTLARDTEALAHLGNSKVVEVLTRDANGSPTLQETRLYQSGKDAVVDDGSTGLIRTLPYVAGEFTTITVAGRERSVLTKFTSSSFLSLDTTGAGASSLNTTGNANASGGIANFSDSTTFDSLPAWLTTSAPVGTVAVAGGNATLDANLNEADYTNSNHLTVHHDLLGTPLSGMAINATYANPNDGTAAGATTYTGVFFEDGSGTPYLVNYGTSRSSTSMFHEGQERLKGNEGYNWFNDAGNISNNPAGRLTGMVYLGLDGSGNAMFDTYAQGSKVGTTKTVFGMGVPVRAGLIYYSFGANSDPADRISFTAMDLTYTYVEP